MYRNVSLYIARAFATRIPIEPTRSRAKRYQTLELPIQHGTISLLERVMDNESESKWVTVAEASEFSEAVAKEVLVGQNVIAIFRDGDSFFALDGLCAHQGGPIAKGQLSKTDVGKTCVTCPWHGWQYELATGIQTVNRQPLQQTFRVRERDGSIEIHIDDSDSK